VRNCGSGALRDPAEGNGRVNHLRLPAKNTDWRMGRRKRPDRVVHGSNDPLWRGPEEVRDSFCRRGPRCRRRESCCEVLRRRMACQQTCRRGGAVAAATRPHW